ncbi:MAG: type II toxin-antitoxin system HicA family toxin [Dehalococcoidia bacterium]|nr:type II toxin-antitoxin system HicA family toxin [Dehalococcoidia bacterium]
MAKLEPVSHGDLVKRLRAFGFEGPYGGGNHLYMLREGLRLTIPNPHRQSVGKDLLIRILRQAEISRKDWTEKSA